MEREDKILQEVQKLYHPLINIFRKKVFIIIVSLCIGGITGYLYRDYTARKDNRITEIPAVEEKKESNTSFVNDSERDAWVEEMTRNDLNEFGPV